MEITYVQVYEIGINRARREPTVDLNTCKAEFVGVLNDGNEPPKKSSLRAKGLACLQIRSRQLFRAEIVECRVEWNGGWDLKVVDGTLNSMRLGMSEQFMRLFVIL